MTTRSAIDLICEGLRAKQNFANNLEYLCDKYEIKDNIFACGADGELEECSEGYFGQVKEYPSLNEAMKELNVYCQGIRVKNGKYAVGNLYQNLADVQESYIIDLKNSLVL